MEIEIIEFYIQKNNIKKKDIKGTMHIRLPQEGIDIRGCFIYSQKGELKAQLPHMTQTDKDGKHTFPCIVFVDEEKNRLLKTTFKRMAIEYVESNYCSFPEVVEVKKDFKEKKLFPKKEAFRKEKCEESPKELKREINFGKVFVDLPPRNSKR